MGLLKIQTDFLEEGIDPSRALSLKSFKHLAAWDVRRHLIRIFGVGGFDIQTKSLDLVKELESNNRWTVIYRAEARLMIKDPEGTVMCSFEDGAIGSGRNQPSLADAHDLAMKTALSQALKRCAVNLGDQFGLSLYKDGSTEAVVNRTLVTLPEHNVPAEELVGQIVATALSGLTVDELRELHKKAAKAQILDATCLDSDGLEFTVGDLIAREGKLAATQQQVGNSGEVSA